MPSARPCSGWGLPSRPDRSGRWCALTAPFHPCRQRRRSLSVALSVRSPRPGSRQHPARWSPDFPRHGRCRAAATRPTHRRLQATGLRPPEILGREIERARSILLVEIIGPGDQEGTVEAVDGAGVGPQVMRLVDVRVGRRRLVVHLEAHTEVVRRADLQLERHELAEAGVDGVRRREPLGVGLDRAAEQRR